MNKKLISALLFVLQEEGKGIYQRTSILIYSQSGKKQLNLHPIYSSGNMHRSLRYFVLLEHITSYFRVRLKTVQWVPRNTFFFNCNKLVRVVTMAMKLFTRRKLKNLAVFIQNLNTCCQVVCLFFFKHLSACHQEPLLGIPEATIIQGKLR